MLDDLISMVFTVFGAFLAGLIIAHGSCSSAYQSLKLKVVDALKKVSHEMLDNCKSCINQKKD